MVTLSISDSSRGRTIIVVLDVDGAGDVATAILGLSRGGAIGLLLDSEDDSFFAILLPGCLNRAIRVLFGGDDFLATVGFSHGDLAAAIRKSLSLDDLHLLPLVSLDDLSGTAITNLDLLSLHKLTINSDFRND